MAVQAQHLAISKKSIHLSKLCTFEVIYSKRKLLPDANRLLNRALVAKYTGVRAEQTDPRTRFTFHYAY